MVRLVVFLQNRSLFLDEANLARNIAEQPFAGLFAPLNYQQYAPPLFMVLEKLSYLSIGAYEWSLRFWPLVMGCLALYLFYRLSLKISDCIIPNILVLWLFAFSQVYIRYATELKQYSTDMAVSSFLLWSALSYAPLERKSYFYYWLLLGSTAIWLSMPSVFILAGIGGYFLYHYFQLKKLVAIGRLLVLGITWMAQFGIYYWLILSRDLQKTNLLSYHQSHFWPLWPNTPEEWQRIGYLIQAFSSTLIGHTFWAILVGGTGILAGLYFSWKKQKDQLLLFVLPVLLCILASGLGLYSLMERLCLFMMPLLGLLFLYGLNGIWHKAPVWGRLLTVLAFLPILPLRKGPMLVFHPLQQEEMRPLLRELGPLITPNDRIWVEHNASAAFIWYTQFDRQSSIGQQQKHLIYNDWQHLAASEIGPPDDPTTPVWLIFSHLVSEQNRQEMEADLQSMRDLYGPPVQELRRPGVAAFAFGKKEVGMFGR